MKTSCLGLIFSLLSTFCFAQNQITLNASIRPTALSASRMPVLMMKYTQDSIFYSGKWYSVKLPFQISDKEKAFGFIAFQGNKSSVLPAEVLIFWDNYGDYQGTLYIDKNFNLDLSDDGDPYYLKDSLQLANVELSHTNFPQSKYSVDLQYIRYKNSQQKEMASTMKADNFPHLKGNTLIDHQFWLTETRNKYLIYKDTLASDSVKIALVDDNINGLFNDIGTDRILIADDATGILQDRPGKNNFTVGDATPLSINGKYYKLNEVSPFGEYLKLSHSNAEDYLTYYEGKLTEGKVIPDLTFETFNGKKASIHQSLSKDKLTLIDIWATWCKGCVEQTEHLKKIDSLYSNKLQIVGLNFDPQSSKAIAYIDKNNINWLQGIADQEIVNSLSVNGFPFYILVNQDKTIHSMGIRLDDVEKVIRKN